MLIKQRTSIPIVSGQDQSRGEELIDPPGLLSAHNCVGERPGELVKRLGWRPRESPAAAALDHPVRLGKRDRELLWFEDRAGSEVSTLRARARSRIVGDAIEQDDRVWHERGNLSRFNTRKLVELFHGRNGYRVGAIDTAFACARDHSEGVILVAWRWSHLFNLGAIRYAAIDVHTQSVIHIADLIPGEPLSTSSKVRVWSMPVGDEWYFYLAFDRLPEQNSTEIAYVAIPATRPWEVEDARPIRSEANAWDICTPDPTIVPNMVYLFASTAGSQYVPFYRVRRLIEASTILTIVDVTYHESTGLEVPRIQNNLMQAVTGPTGAHAAVAFGIYPGNTGGGDELSRLMVAQFDCPSTELNSVTVADEIEIDAPGANVSWNGAQIGWSGNLPNGAADNWHISWVRYNDTNRGMRQAHLTTVRAGSTVTLARAVYPVSYMSAPYGRYFFHGGQAYQPVVSGFSNDVVVVQIAAMLPPSGDAQQLPKIEARFLAGYIAPDNAWSWRFERGHNSTAESYVERGRFFSAFARTTTDGTQDVLTIMEIDGRDPQRFHSAELHGLTYVSGSIPRVFDGYHGHEVGFGLRPQSGAGDVTIEAVATTGASLAAGSYQVAMTWEAIDASGHVTQSAPSISNVAIVGAEEVLNLSYRILEGAEHANAYGVVWVRNMADPAFIRSQQAVPTATVPGDFEFTLAPQALFQAGMPELYTSRGILECAPPPSIRYIETFQNRLWGMNEDRVYYTREYVDQESLAFNEAFEISLPSTGTGIKATDDRLVLFCEDAILWISGEGPTDTGEGGAFSTPQRLPVEFGCIDARSIVRTDVGICFQSRRGIELLGRDFSTQVVSGGIEKLIRGNYIVVVAASWDQTKQIARFVLRSRFESEEDLVACWHTALGWWTTHDVPLQPDSLTAARVIDITRCDGRNWMALDTLQLTQESVARCVAENLPTDVLQCLDGPITAPRWYGMTVQSSNIKFDGLLGFKRVWRVYPLLKDITVGTGFAVGYAIDYERGTRGAMREWLTSEDIAACRTNVGHYMPGIHLDVQQCSAVRLYIEDRQMEHDWDEPFETRMTLVGFGIDWGQKRGTGRGRERSKL